MKMKGVIIADDLTGANASGVLLKKLGLRVSSIFQPDRVHCSDSDVIAYSTDSRGLAPEDSYARVYEAFLRLKQEACFFNKRIDSTLRGNIGTEIDAALDALGDGYTAMVVPAYPDSGRIVVNRTMLVDGVLLSQSDAGRDLKMPVLTDDVEQLIRAQMRYRCLYIPLQEIVRGISYLRDIIRTARREARVVIFDAVRNEDIRTVAQAILASGDRILTVDPGPLTMHYVHEQQVREKREQKILMVIGSVTETTKRQIACILQKRSVYFVQMKVDAFFDPAERQEEVERIVEKICGVVDEEDFFLLTTTPIGTEEEVDLSATAARLGVTTEDVSNLLADTLARAAVDVLERTRKMEGIYCSGGDITISILKRLHAAGIDIRDEVIPLAVYGRILGGRLPNLKVVTKGGMIGGDDTIERCLDKMVSNL